MLSASSTIEPRDLTVGLAQARRLRHERYSQVLGWMPSSNPAEDLRDAAGWVLVATDKAKPVGTIRLTPVCDQPELEMRALGLLPTWAEDDPTLCEASRLAVSPEGSGVEVMSSAATWLLENTHMRRYIAYCRTRVLPAMLRIGARAVSAPTQIDARPGADFVVILGTLATVAQVSGKGIHPIRMDLVS